MTLGQLADQADLMGQTHVGSYLRHVDELWRQVRLLRLHIWDETMYARLLRHGHTGDLDCPELAIEGVCEWCEMTRWYADITSDGSDR